jgi:cyd operon protein YbgE
MIRNNVTIPDATLHDTPRWNRAPARALSLAIAVAISILVLVWPVMFVNAQGRADHGWLTLLMWGMSAGFVHGVGFVPRHWIPRALFGPVAAWGLPLIAAIGIRFF